MIELRDYQRKALDELYEWFNYNEGNPCVEAPTGAGKSVLIAKFCEENIQANPNIRIVIVTHVKELVQQDHDAVLRAWPEAPIGIWSAGIGRKEIEQITVCGIQSIYKHADLLGKVDVVIVDEAHLIPVSGTGMYLTFINALKETNPDMTVIGFTATPYRLKHGMITDEPAIFKEPIVQTIDIKTMQDRGYLAMLRSKSTCEKLTTKGVKIQGGDFVEKDLQRVIDNDGTSRSVVKETLVKAADRNHIIFFCCGIEHAEHIRDLLREEGETAETISANTPIKERDQIISDFKSGKIRFLTNTAVLTTGFDYPDIDCIVMMRPTLSPGLYVQIAGRGLRLKSNSGDCLVLDYAGNVSRHGPITDVLPPNRAGKRKGVAPSKICPECDEIVAVQTMVCPTCGHVWERKEHEEDYHLHDDDISGRSAPSIDVGWWRWTRAKSRAGEDMVKVTYAKSMISRFEVNEYFLLWRDDYVGVKAQKLFMFLVKASGLDPYEYDTIEEMIDALNTKGNKPTKIEYGMNGKWPVVKRRLWDYV